MRAATPAKTADLSHFPQQGAFLRGLYRHAPRPSGSARPPVRARHGRHRRPSRHAVRRNWRPAVWILRPGRHRGLPHAGRQRGDGGPESPGRAGAATGVRRGGTARPSRVAAGAGRGDRPDRLPAAPIQQAAAFASATRPNWPNGSRSAAGCTGRSPGPSVAASRPRALSCRRRRPPFTSIPTSYLYPDFGPVRDRLRGRHGVRTSDAPLPCCSSGTAWACWPAVHSATTRAPCGYGSPRAFCTAKRTGSGSVPSPRARRWKCRGSRPRWTGSRPSWPTSPG